MKRFLLLFLSVLLTFANGYAQVPNVDQPANKVVCNGATVAQTDFTGTNGARFTWTSTNPAVGLTASGSGNLPAFTATNSGSTPISSTITVTPVFDYAYIPNSGSNTVSVFGTALNPITATIGVNIASPTGIALSPDGTRLYTANFSSNVISIINTVTNTLISNFNLATGASGPRDIAVSPDGKTLYVANLISDNISVINLDNNFSTIHIPVGNEPIAIAVSPNGSKVYVANSGATTISVIDTDTKTSSTITVPFGPRDVAVSPDGTKVYVASYNGNSISIINTADNNVTNIGASQDARPYGIAVSPDGSKVYIANNKDNSVSVFDPTINTFVGPPISVGEGSIRIAATNSKVFVANSTSGTVSVINTATNRVMATIERQIGVYDVVVSADGMNTYISRGGSNSIEVIDNTAFDIRASVPVQNGLTGVAVNVSQSRVYITNYDRNNVSVINTATNQLLETIDVGNAPNGIAVSPDGTRVYVVNSGDRNVSVINTSNNQVIETIGVGASPVGIAVSPDGSRVYVTNLISDDVTVINTASNQAMETIAVGDAPNGIAVSPDGTRVYVANSSDNSVSVINTSNNQIVATINIIANNNQAWPAGIVVSPDGTRVYVANRASGNVSVINTSNNQVVATIPVGAWPLGVSITPDGSKLFVVNNQSNSVSVINTATNSLLMTLAVEASPIALGNFIGVSAGTPKTFTITVNPSVAIVSQPDAKTVCVGSPASFAVIATGTNLTYQWRKGGVDIAGATTNAYTITNTTAADAGTYDVVVTSDCGTVISSAVDLTVTQAISFLSQPTAQTVCAGGSATFSVVVGSGGAIGFQWRKDGQNIPSATNDTYTINNVSAGDVANYDVQVFGSNCGSAISNAVPLTLTPSTAIVSAPADQTVCAGSPVTFTVTATGSNVKYQWQKDGQDIANATSPTYTLASAAAGDAGRYSVLVIGDCGPDATLAAILTVNPVPTPVIIATGPTTVCEADGGVLLTSSATTNNHQWFKDNVPVNSPDGRTFRATASGSYTVQATENGCTSPVSAPVTITVNPTPPVPTITATGNILTSSAATGNQWHLNGVAIQGATGQTHRVQASGLYTVFVTEGSCSEISVPFNFVATRIDTTESWNRAITVYPNPAVKQLVVKNKSGHPILVQLFDSMGKRVYNSTLQGSQTTIDVERWSTGMYQIVITDLTTNETTSQSIIKL